MNSDKVENTEGPRAYVSPKENSHVESEECEERSERHDRNRIEKGLQFYLEIGTKKRERAIKEVRSRIDAIYECPRLPADLVKLNTCKDGLEAELNNCKTVHESVTDLLIRLELTEREQRVHSEYVDLNNTALECMADVKVRIKDQEIERAKLLSQRSLRSRKSSPSVRSSSTSSSKCSAIETAKLKAKLDTLRCQDIDTQ